MKNLLTSIMFLVSAVATAEEAPRIEFAFEERVTISPAVEIGNTALGHRQFIPITGGTVTGPKFKGKVLPLGRDLQLTYSGSDCTQLSADYFIQSEDGVIVHVFNEGLYCPGTERTIFRPRLEAPKGKFEWMTRATFVATLEVEAPENNAVRIRIYQVK